MHMGHAPFQKANAVRHVTGDERASHHVPCVIKSWKGEIRCMRTAGADTGALHGWQNECNIWKERGMLV